jgi:hypothetical protein
MLANEHLGLAAHSAAVDRYRQRELRELGE